MKNDLLHKIVTICLRMDENAAEIYKKLSRSAEKKGLKKFWAQMSMEESQHVSCWEDLLTLVEKKVVPQIFVDPKVTLKELQKNFQKTVEIAEQNSESADLTENFVLAFRLEFYLLHPALEELWHFYGIIREKQYNPEHEYESHIHKFIEAMRKFGASTIELEALGETVERMWHNTKRTAQEANFDELTKTLNRRGLIHTMTSLAYLAKRNSFYCAVLMIDIDHFKRINDTYGHQKGDDVLREIAGIIKTSIRASDIAGRYGGEEFIVFLPQIEEESLHPIAEKIRNAIQKQAIHDVPVTASIGGKGMYIKETVENEIHELIKQADSNLYEAKDKGRNRVVC